MHESIINCMIMSHVCVLKVNGCHENTIEEWEGSSFPDGAHLVNIQRGDKGFGVILVERKVYTVQRD